MNKIFLAIALLGVTNIYAQSKFQCNDINSYQVLQKYNEIKHLGVNYKSPNNKEIIPLMIDILKDDGLRQICIDAAYDDHLKGTENNYRRYIRDTKNISREAYMKNYDFLEMFNRMVTVLEETTNYRRKR
ncbi:hypothetical protein [Riemerella columbina]|uniref:hypothetical protein n=1 Tax=Riemerella columbina TaxID=103810 RepID=UPI00038182F6|nr:hypothetical protein [Riemerella columbina]